MTYELPIAYSAGVYGWNCDCYTFDDVLICTGCRTIPNKNAKPTYTMTQRYNDEAEQIECNYKLPHDERKQALRLLIAEFIAEAKLNYSIK